MDRKEKIRRIQEILDLEYPIKIKESNEINAYAHKANEIYITTAALDHLDFDELVFMAAHEEAHLDRQHHKTNSQYADAFMKDLENSWTENRGFLGKLFSIAGTFAVGIAGKAAIAQIEELEADLNAARKAKEKGYGGGAKKFFERLDYGLSFDHPSSRFRKTILEKLNIS